MTDSPKPRKPITHVLMAVDKSGSMGKLAEDVRGSFNTYLDELRRDDSRYRITVALFDQQYHPFCQAKKIKNVPRLDHTTYSPSGGTALLDAVGQLIAEFDQAQLAEDDRVLLVVQTDGEENSSREYSRDTIRAMIKEREASGRWSFVFIGAGIDAWKQSESMGFRRTSTVDVDATSVGTHSTYSGLTRGTRAYAAGGDGVAVAAAVTDAQKDSAP